LGLALVMGATARLTRLVAKDKIAIGIRIAAANRDARQRAAALVVRRRLPAVPGVDTSGPSSPTSPTYEFVTCPWCVSVWIGAAVSALYLIAPHGAAQTWVQWLYAALTASHGSAYLVTREPTS